MDRGDNRAGLGHSGTMNSEQMDHQIRLAKQIEAGLLAQDILDGASMPLSASNEELQALVFQGRMAKDELVLSHLGLVRVIAVDAVRRCRASMSDVFQEGCVGLQQAVMSYDWRKGSFGPYAAMWIRAAVRRVAPRRWAPLDADVEDRRTTGSIDNSVTREGLAQALDLIPRRERQVLRLRSGWEGPPLTLRDTADRLGMTVSQVRHIERSGYDAMRQHWMAEAA